MYFSWGTLLSGWLAGWFFFSTRSQNTRFVIIKMGFVAKYIWFLERGLYTIWMEYGVSKHLYFQWVSFAIGQQKRRRKNNFVRATISNRTYSVYTIYCIISGSHWTAPKPFSLFLIAENEHSKQEISWQITNSTWAINKKIIYTHTV